MGAVSSFFDSADFGAVAVAQATKGEIHRRNRSIRELGAIIDQNRTDLKTVRDELADEKKKHAATVEQSRQKSLTIEKLKGDLTDIRLLRQELEKAKAENARLADEISGMRRTIRFQAMAMAGLQKVISLFKSLHPDSAMFQMTRHKDGKGNKLVHWVHMYNQAFDEYGRSQLKIRNPETYREAP